MNVNLNAKAEDDWTCLHWSASGGHDSVIVMLVEAGADVNMVNSLGQTPISAAVLAAHISTIKTLHEQGASLNITAKNGMSLLDNALLGGWVIHKRNMI